jgi:hypothetical protein
MRPSMRPSARPSARRSSTAYDTDRIVVRMSAADKKKMLPGALREPSPPSALFFVLTEGGECFRADDFILFYFHEIKRR